MKYKYSIVLFVILISASCSNTDKGNILKSNESTDVFKKYLKTMPPYAPFINTPEDTLLFGFSKGSVSFDTSWTLTISKSKGTTINCRYNQLLPNTVSGIEDYMDESTKLIYYEGFSFEIDEQKWNNLRDLSGIDKYTAKDSIRYDGCLHCPRYTAYFESKLIVNSKLDNKYLVRLDSILHNEVINTLLEKKRNPPIQIKKVR